MWKVQPFCSSRCRAADPLSSFTNRRQDCREGRVCKAIPVRTPCTRGRVEGTAVHRTQEQQIRCLPTLTANRRQDWEGRVPEAGDWKAKRRVAQLPHFVPREEVKSLVLPRRVDSRQIAFCFPLLHSLQVFLQPSNSLFFSNSLF